MQPREFSTPPPPSSIPSLAEARDRVAAQTAFAALTFDKILEKARREAEALAQFISKVTLLAANPTIQTILVHPSMFAVLKSTRDLRILHEDNGLFITDACDDRTGQLIFNRRVRIEASASAAGKQVLPSPYDYEVLVHPFFERVATMLNGKEIEIKLRFTGHAAANGNNHASFARVRVQNILTGQYQYFIGGAEVIPRSTFEQMMYQVVRRLWLTSHNISLDRTELFLYTEQEIFEMLRLLPVTGKQETVLAPSLVAVNNQFIDNLLTVLLRLAVQPNGRDFFIELVMEA